MLRRRRASRITEQDIRVIAAGHRGRPRPGHRLQQVGPPRRGAPLLPRARDRAASSCRCRGRRGSTSRPAPAGTWTGSCPALETALESLGHPGPDRPAQRLPRRDRRRPPAPGPRRQAAAHPVRAPRPSTRPPRFVLFAIRLPRGRLPPLHRAPAARGVRLRGHADRGLGAGAREAPPLTSGRECARPTGGPIRSRGARCASVPLAPRGASRAVAQLGSALDWGSRGRRFKSCQPDGKRTTPEAASERSGAAFGVSGGRHGRRAARGRRSAPAPGQRRARSRRRRSPPETVKASMRVESPSCSPRSHLSRPTWTSRRATPPGPASRSAGDVP